MPLNVFRKYTETIHICILPTCKLIFFNSHGFKAPGWLCQLSVCLQLRSWSPDPGIKPCVGLHAQRGVCFSLSLCPFSHLCSLPLSCSLYRSNKIVKENNSHRLIRNCFQWDPWVAQRFGACLWPRARSWRPGIESHALCSRCMEPASPSACVSACVSASASLSLSASLWINK